MKEIQFVSHTINARNFEIALDKGFVEPVSKWKAGFSVDGCFALIDHGQTSSYYVDLIFDFADIKDKLKPTIYLPLNHYWWYKAAHYMITWYHLAWETELCLLKGEKIDLSLVKKIRISGRRRKLRDRVSPDFTLIKKLPWTPNQIWARSHANLQQENSRRLDIANEYNGFIAEIYDLDFEQITANFHKFVEEEEIKRLGRTCRICRFYDFQFKDNKLERKCQTKKAHTGLDDICKNWGFRLESFVTS